MPDAGFLVALFFPSWPRNGYSILVSGDFLFSHTIVRSYIDFLSGFNGTDLCRVNQADCGHPTMTIVGQTAPEISSLDACFFQVCFSFRYEG
jgi:hypothetical protein